jgi:sugar lactone lactonase YvrE
VLKPAVFEEVQGWLKMPPRWRLQEASSVAIDSGGRVMILHRGEHPLLRADADGHVIDSIADGRFQKTFMTEPDGTPYREEWFNWVHGLRIDPQDHIWVTDIGRNVVLKFSAAGRLELTLGTDGTPGNDPVHFDQPTDIAFSPDGNVYISDGYGNSRVVRFAADGRYLSAWGTRGTGSGEFNTPHGITVGPDGRVYVAERLNNRVQVFDPIGRPLSAWDDLPNADAVRFGPDGSLYVGSGHGLRTFQRIGPDGPEVLASRDEIGYPRAFCFDREGNLYAADPIAHTVRKFRRRAATLT